MFHLPVDVRLVSQVVVQVLEGVSLSEVGEGHGYL